MISEPLSKLADETGCQHYENPLENFKPVDWRTSMPVLVGRLYPKMIFRTHQGALEPIDESPGFPDLPERYTNVGLPLAGAATLPQRAPGTA